jgi:pimeloyl-ACP methyl ester carboxylesterase
MAKQTADPADYIQPLNMNGLEGRMLHMPHPKNGKREILFVYGHHSSLERWWGIAKFLNRYTAVTMPDLPGFGGMDSFHKIGKKPDIDTFADYLAAFVKLRYNRKRVIIVGMSFGFVVATRMLQRYPELTKRIDMLVSFAGFAHQDDFTFSRPRRAFYLGGTRLLSHKLPAAFFRQVCLHPAILRAVYRRTNNAKDKFAGVIGEELEEITRFEINLWHTNDIRTWAYTTVEFLRLDNCQVQVGVPVYHLAVDGDRYFDNNRVEQHFRVIFSDFVLLTTLKLANHAPSVIADEKAAAAFVPPKLRRMLKD